MHRHSIVGISIASDCYCLYLSVRIQDDDPNRIIHIWFKNSISAISNGFFLLPFYIQNLLSCTLYTCTLIHIHIHTTIQSVRESTLGSKKRHNSHNFHQTQSLFFVTCLILICSFYSCFLLYHRIFRSGTGSDGKFHLLPTGELLIHNLGEYQKYILLLILSYNRCTKKKLK